MPKSLTIRSFLPQREIEICQRVREIRIARRLEQAEFAEKIGISRSRLSSYEYAKAPIKYALGKEICYRFNVSQKWFATNLDPKSPYFDVSPNLEFQIPAKSLFSAAYDDVLRPYIEEREGELKQFVGEEVFYHGETSGEVLDNFHLVGENPAKAAEFYVRKAVLFRLHWLPPELKIKYGELIIQADKTFQKKYGKQLAKLIAAVPNKSEPKNNLLTVDSLKSKSDAMQSEIQKLIEKVKKKSAQPGAKSRLADWLGVSPARISEWLAGKKEPGGNYTLLLDKWVREQSAK